MLRFNRLKLSGFKSFVEQTELVIESGLTGIVGPNGCGKSNLVEALRWAMGETSAKQMRGSGMDDMIFSGTNDRPARNVAEVTLSLDNSERTAPALFNDSTELNVSRRIERETGSTYRLNGKEVRARDVQLLFADSATGARSTALVSQGRIGAIIAAKPVDRRKLLEEAAGITGLHSRRHEAELRLRAAETNLERLEDILGTLDVQMQSLKKQARQANRYRNISSHIRKAEAMLLHLRISAAREDLAKNEEKLRAAETEVAALTAKAGAASSRQTDRATKLPEHRQAEAEAAAELQRLELAREHLEAEQQRIEAARANCEARLAQTAADMERERALIADAEAALRMLSEERTRIETVQHAEAASRDEAAALLQEATRTVSALEAELSELTSRLAAREARRNSLQQSIEALSDRRHRLGTRAAEIAEAHAAAEREATDTDALKAAEERATTAREDLDLARARLENASREIQTAREAVNASTGAVHEAQQRLTRLEAEEKALADMIEMGPGDLFPPLIDAVTVEPGLEAALGAALGDDLSAPADEPAPVHWRTLLPMADAPALPAGAEPLSDYVRAPAALHRRLSQIGLVADSETGARLAADLKVGQRLVSRDGALWRWDGYTVSAGAATAAATRLEKRNRLKELREEFIGIRRHAANAEARLREVKSLAETAQADERTARETANRAEETWNAARDAFASLREKTAELSSKLASLQESKLAVESDLAETTLHLRTAEEEFSTLTDIDALREQASACQATLNEHRTVQLNRQSAFDNLSRAAEERRERLEAIVREVESWTGRRDAATRKLEELTARQQEQTEEHERLEKAPEELKTKHATLMGQIETAELTRKVAADELAVAESHLREADRELREAEIAVAQAREARVRIEGLVEQAKQAVDNLIERIRERIEAAPEDLLEIAEHNPEKELPDMDSVERRHERLLRERDTMGPVNLRAEQEAQELEEQIETLNTERIDLVEAIDKLRQGINQLNREGRERLLASFKEVDGHFQDLFVRLFGGGRAHLQLTEADDPLEAGLEILASPPGKKMQVLSLLSGGEQALTALSLLFAVFMTNPAPICVLDEVDAPLDDANVDRFCNLLDEMSESGHTRFMIITHHRMTMARMHRLFGVTMAEQGVSQLVSVDLQQAEGLREQISAA
ncbi:MAG: chromosome segregation protein SMC [Rhodospirillales bacterium]